ncbi:hypothetical protein P280DRAFT_469301 [Massarina eburnea CBS 473.64]|uniref:AA9 family lytic polysaccharide monooxygenase n=1 Tax=Massarina eburnea CBS 473.64 TaxID=1395130 RepID=A0A6A6RYB3_9PLEO|nr:hypothetical protein P280DRAFT_469301 [Massarina eburnea CBS 473.64]
MAPMKQVAALVGALATSVSAHGLLSKITVDGTEYEAYNPSFQYQDPAPEVIEWSCPECQDNGYVDPTMYTDVTKIACHKDATAGAKVASVKAGGSIDIQWTTWPESHKGPVLDYLAKVDDATATESGDLQFFKIDQKGYTDSTWASDELLSNNLTWTVTVPSDIASGQYVLRHEIIALHSAGQEDGAQNYPKCINIEVTDGGSTSPSGETADKFYTPSDAGLLVNIYSGDLSGYEIPGPALYDASGSSSGSGSTAAASSAVATSAAASSAAATSAVATSAAVTSATSSAVQATSTSLAQDVQNVQTTQTTAIVTSTVNAAASEAPAATSAADPLVSQIASISTDIPSAIYTSILPTAIPTGIASNGSGSVPSSPIPQGVTIKDLLEWLSYAMRTYVKGERKSEGNSRAQSQSQSQRQHARSF